MSYSPEDYTLVKEPDYFNQFSTSHEGDDEFPDITNDREPNWGQA